MDETELTKGPRRSGAAGPPLSRALERAIDELRDEVATARAGPVDRRHLSEIVCRIAHQARADGLRAEELVIVFRRVWRAPAPTSPGHPELRADMLVGALIAAFYEDRATPSA